MIKQELNREYHINPTGDVISWHETITGIYRFTVFSEHQFNIEVFVRNNNYVIIATNKGINTVIIIIENEPYLISFNIKAVDANVVRSKFSYIVEYVSAV